ncbi:acyltransferase superfamily protein [Ventosimonas gracilis]|uniref:Acyltransferase superfamily protein n=1 Tax=Ventosimonas gracilis TaxID=1680762 RepID=A0A139SRU7_9GAMM|nr:GNAT family N-acetyltransferase [Ventosimonas gracilis]KXU37306.1 acyltransferase superfamily protein [Ventosimonas gracilis]
MSLQIIHSLSAVNAKDWDALLPNAQPFLRHAFLSALEDSQSVCGKSGWQAAHGLWVENGKLLAALPAYRKQHSSGEYVFDYQWAHACQRVGIAYYPKLLGAVPFIPVSGPRLLGDPAAASKLLQALTLRLAKDGLSGAHINFTDHLADKLLADCDGWMERIGCQFHWHNPGFADFEDFLQTLTARKRKQLRKERAQIAQQGFAFDWREGHELSEADWDFIYACYAQTYRVRGQRPYLTRLFFSLLSERMALAIRVVLASQGGQKQAMALSLTDGKNLYGRWWGCLAEWNGLHFETCLYQGMDYAIAQGLHEFDAGAQGEHKLLRGFRPTLTRSWHYLCHDGLRQAVRHFLAEERRAVQGYMDEAQTLLPYRQD